MTWAFLWQDNFPLHGSTILCIHLVWAWSPSSLSLGSRNSIVMLISVHILMWLCFQLSWVWLFTDRAYENSQFHSLEVRFFPKSLPCCLCHYAPTRISEVSNFSLFLPALVIACLSHPIPVRSYLLGSSLKARDGKHVLINLYMHLYVLWTTVSSNDLHVVFFIIGLKLFIWIICHVH